MGRELGFSPGSHHKLQNEDGDWERFIAKEEFNRYAELSLLEPWLTIQDTFVYIPPRHSVYHLPQYAS